MRYSKILLAIVLISMLVFGSTMSAYAATMYMLTVSVNAGSAGMGTVTGGGEYSTDAQALVTATPNAGYQFVKWVVVNCTSAPTEIFTSSFINMHKHDVAIEAYFKAVVAEQRYNLNITVNDASMGTVLGSGNFNYTQYIDVSATPKPGYHFVKWEVNFGSGFGPAPFDTPAFTCNLSHCGDFVPNVELRAYFAPDPVSGFEVSAIVEDEVGWGTVTGTGVYEEGDLVTLTAIPSVHFSFDEWTGPDYVYLESDEGDVITFFMPDQAVEVTAYFNEESHVMATIQYLNASNVVIKPEIQQKMYLGNYTLTPPAIPGYNFGISTANASGTITEASQNFTVVYKYYVPEVVTNTVTNTVTETVYVTVPATTAATTEIVTTEAVPLAAPVPFNIDAYLEDIPLPESEDVTGDEIMDEVVPLADALPATGQLSVDYFYGIGGLISGLGLWLKRRK